MPRVPLLTREDMPSEKQELYDQIASYRGHVARPFAALLNSPETAARVAMVGNSSAMYHQQFHLALEISPR